MRPEISEGIVHAASTTCAGPQDLAESGDHHPDWSRRSCVATPTSTILSTDTAASAALVRKPERRLWPKIGPDRGDPLLDHQRRKAPAKPKASRVRSRPPIIESPDAAAEPPWSTGRLGRNGFSHLLAGSRCIGTPDGDGAGRDDRTSFAGAGQMPDVEDLGHWLR